MAFVLNSVIDIELYKEPYKGVYKLIGGVNDVSIIKGVNSFIDTAKIKLPGLGHIENKRRNLPLGRIETAAVFNKGDKVSIRLGYNGDLNTEFIGFIARINLTRPLELELEGYAFQLRRNQIEPISWKTTTVRQVLEHITYGTDITLSEFIPEIKLSNFYIKKENGLQVLNRIKEKLLICIYFNGLELYAGLEEGIIKKTVKYVPGWNTIRDGNLTLRNGSDDNVRVRLVTSLKNGKRVLYEAGDVGGSIIERVIPFCTDANFLQKSAESFLKKLKVDGYEGSITAFLQPYCEPANVAFIEDKKHGHSGKYFVRATEVTFGMNGARRKVSILGRLDDPKIN